MFPAPYRTLTTPGTTAGSRGWQRYATIILTAISLLFAAPWARAGQAPQVLLFDATLDEARGFAVDTAASRGWSILSVTSGTAVFEQSLEDDDEDAANRHLLRIYADFAEESSGVRVALRAEEVERPDTAEETMADVTGRYSDNLSNALASLRGKWDARRESSGATADTHPSVAMGKLSARTDQSTGRPLGTWSYNAERYAESRGCVLTDGPTQLTASGPGWEQHQIACRNGTSLRVECRHGDCTSRP